MWVISFTIGPTDTFPTSSLKKSDQELREKTLGLSLVQFQLRYVNRCE